MNIRICTNVNIYNVYFCCVRSAKQMVTIGQGLKCPVSEKRKQRDQSYWPGSQDGWGPSGDTKCRGLKVTGEAAELEHWLRLNGRHSSAHESLYILAWSVCINLGSLKSCAEL